MEKNYTCMCPLLTEVSLLKLKLPHSACAASPAVRLGSVLAQNFAACLHLLRAYEGAGAVRRNL
jgi:hypothetical protein